ncbi:MAG: hypothetical protein ACPGTU_03620 [Myxococcota bacterium]
MGLRDRIKGKVKSALGISEDGSERVTAPEASTKHSESDAVSEKDSGGEDTPWYLKYDDLDGWDNTNASDAVDED